MKIYVRISEVLKQKNKTKTWLAREMNGSFSSINNLINNKTTRINFSTLAKICELLECDIKDILVLKK